MSVKLDDALEQIAKLQKDIQDNYSRSTSFFDEMNKNESSREQIVKKIMNNEKLDPNIRVLASLLNCLNSGVMTFYCSFAETLAQLNMVTALTGYSLSIFNSELLDLKKQKTTLQDTEKLKVFEKKLEGLKKITKQWKPIIDDLKEGQERTKKYLCEKR
jgi:hypothetical protein